MNYPRFAALKGRRTLWLRQMGDAGEATYADVIATLTTFGYQGLTPKVMDGLTWQRDNDPTGKTPFDSLQSVEVVRDQFAAAGLVFVPVVVPRYWAGAGAPDPEAQAATHGALAALCGCLMTDIEPYDGFWGARQELIPVYTKALRQAAGDAYLINQPDPRDYGRTAARVAETAGDFDAICAQHYVGWATAGWTDITTELAVLRKVAELGRELYVTLYGVERTDLARAFGARAIAAGALGVNVFTLGPMNAAELRTFGDLPLTAAPDPIPGTVPPTPIPVPAPDFGAYLAEFEGWTQDDEQRVTVQASIAVAHASEGAAMRRERIAAMRKELGL